MSNANELLLKVEATAARIVTVLGRFGSWSIRLTPREAMLASGVYCESYNPKGGNRHSGGASSDEWFDGVNKQCASGKGLKQPRYPALYTDLAALALPHMVDVVIAEYGLPFECDGSMLWQVLVDWVSEHKVGDEHSQLAYVCEVMRYIGEQRQQHLTRAVQRYSAYNILHDWCKGKVVKYGVSGYSDYMPLTPHKLTDSKNHDKVYIRLKRDDTPTKCLVPNEVIEAIATLARMAK